MRRHTVYSLRRRRLGRLAGRGGGGGRGGHGGRVADPGGQLGEVGGVLGVLQDQGQRGRAWGGGEEGHGDTRPQLAPVVELERGGRGELEPGGGAEGGVRGGPRGVTGHQLQAQGGLTLPLGPDSSGC